MAEAKEVNAFRIHTAQALRIAHGVEHIVHLAFGQFVFALRFAAAAIVRRERKEACGSEEIGKARHLFGGFKATMIHNNERKPPESLRLTDKTGDFQAIALIADGHPLARRRLLQIRRSPLALAVAEQPAQNEHENQSGRMEGHTGVLRARWRMVTSAQKGAARTHERSLAPQRSRSYTLPHAACRTRPKL